MTRLTFEPASASSVNLGCLTSSTLVGNKRKGKGMAHQAEALLEQYISFWNERDEQIRKATFPSTFTPDATYQDPRVHQVSGFEAINALVEAFHSGYDGARFTLTGIIGVHPEAVLFGWSLAATPSVPASAGYDVAYLSDDRISGLVGFNGVN
ncbi:nuclear transport factor 2 family protein [Actinoplanes sp. NPDC000266]